MSKKAKISVSTKNERFTTYANKGTNLLNHLQNNNLKIVAPCGGLGTCGKCIVHISTVGDVLACKTIVDKDIKIVLPNQSEMQVLEAQHEYTVNYPLNPIKIVSDKEFPIGIAVDIGTTTIVSYFINLKTGQLINTQSKLNPQIKYGADVISRISYSIDNKYGIQILQQELINLINEQIITFTKTNGNNSNSIVKICFTGNTTMLHFLAGVDASSLGLAPYVAKFIDKQSYSAKELGINCNLEAELILMPSLSAFVGSDVVSGLASLNLPETIKNYLYIDIGTNGEMAIVTPSKIISCATAAGPAFEGANIKCGMAAQEGAIDTYTEKGFTTIGQVAPAGICGSGLIDIIAVLIDINMIDKHGLMGSEFILVDKTKSLSEKTIVLTPEDIREVQLAKSAIAAGLHTLIKQANLKIEDIDALVMAGGFGNYIRTSSAIKIGLIPKELEDKVIPVGNAASTGAIQYLLSTEFEKQVEIIREKMVAIDLFAINDFVEDFALQMDFPD